MASAERYDCDLVELPAFDIAGAPGAPVIVFIHGSGRNRKMWLPQMAALSDVYRVVALDLPGHGRLARQRFVLARAAEDVALAIGVQGARRALVVGISLGGYVAMTFADRFPGRAAGLALASCAVRFDGRYGPLARTTALVFQALDRLLGASWLAWRVRDQEAAIRQRLPPELAEPQISAGIRLAEWGRALTQMAAQDYRAVLARYSGPVLVLSGERDRYNRAAEREQVRGARDGRLAVIPNAGHLASLDNPAAFTREIRRFAHAIDFAQA